MDSFKHSLTGTTRNVAQLHCFSQSAVSAALFSQQEMVVFLGPVGVDHLEEATVWASIFLLVPGADMNLVGTFEVLATVWGPKK